MSLLLLLLLAEQGAVVHEFSHFLAGNGASLRTDAGSTLDSACTLCPVYAQAATAPFSHVLQVPRLARVDLERQAEPPPAVTEAAVPRPRSRGPPSES